jgi:hypothetical protein
MGAPINNNQPAHIKMRVSGDQAADGYYCLGDSMFFIDIFASSSDGSQVANAS